MKHLLILVALSAASLCLDAYAQTDGYTVSGRVIDRVTREGIPYAAVVVVGLDGSGVSADSAGYFVLDKVKP